MKIIFPQQVNMLNAIICQLKSGKKLADALLITGLSKTILSQIAIADVHGNLIKCLLENAETLTVQKKNMKKIANLLTYPIFLMLILISLIIFLKVELSNQLPTVKIAKVYKIGCFIILICLIIVIFLEYLYLRSLTELKRADRKLKLPFIGAIYQNYYHYVILTAIATFLKSGLSLNEILLASNELTTGSIQQELTDHVQTEVLNGLSLEHIVNKQLILPNEINVALGLGHSTEQIAMELQTIAEIKHERLQQQLIKLINQIQPIFFIIVAVMILGTYLSILLPIYSMMKGL